MPCYEVNLVSVEFSAKHKDVLLRALDALGLRYVEERGGVAVRGGIWIDLVNSRATGYAQATLNQIKQEYSRQAILTAAQRRGAVVQQDKQKQYAGKVVLRR